MLDFDSLYDQQSEEFKAIFAQKHNKMQKTSDFFAEKVRQYRNDGWKDHATIWNVAFFLNMTTLDVSVLLYQLVQERDLWSRKLTARHLTIAIYEAMNELASLMGKPIRLALTNLNLLKEVDGDLRQARKPIDEFMRAHSSFLKNIRDKSAAHRDNDSLILYDTISSIDITTVYDAAKSFGDLQNGLGPKLQKIIDRAAEVKPLPKNQ